MGPLKPGGHHLSWDWKPYRPVRSVPPAYNRPGWYRLVASQTSLYQAIQQPLNSCYHPLGSSGWLTGYSQLYWGVKPMCLEWHITRISPPDPFSNVPQSPYSETSTLCSAQWGKAYSVLIWQMKYQDLGRGTTLVETTLRHLWLRNASYCTQWRMRAKCKHLRYDSYTIWDTLGYSRPPNGARR